MKKIVSILLVCLLVMSLAMAQNMTVVNCDEWVSLRLLPDKTSDRLAKVPLGATVCDCEEEGDFIYCEYDGQCGYILAEYLESAEAEETGDPRNEIVCGSYSILPEYNYTDDAGETLNVIVFKDGEPVWSMETGTGYVTELSGLDTFFGGTAEHPVVLIFNCEEALTAYDADTGAQLWSLPASESGIGGSPCHAVDSDGTIYMMGYYDDAPTAVSADGQLLWQSDYYNPDIYWPYEISIGFGSITVTYDREPARTVTYSTADGSMLGVN